LFLLIFSISIAAGSLSISWLLKGQVTTKYVPATAYTMGAFFIIFWLACSRFSMAPGGGIADFMAASGGWFVLLALIGIAFAGGMFIVPLYAVLQTQSHADDCAQTIASNNIYNALFAVLLVIVSTMMLSWGLTVPQLIGALGVETLLGAVLVYGKRGRE
jgi:acyl-[acyl-carrier-protein]-phospholipid O-acyltransferase/long-chain-fatty-acid--[acyl-carrier-protein] ligase